MGAASIHDIDAEMLTMVSSFLGGEAVGDSRIATVTERRQWVYPTVPTCVSKAHSELAVDLRRAHGSRGGAKLVGDLVGLVGRQLDVLRLAVVMAQHDLAMQDRYEREDLERSVSREFDLHSNDLA